MAQVVLDRSGFRIADLDGDEMVSFLMRLETGQTRELVVDGVRGWWERAGGWTREHAFMAPSQRTRQLLAGQAPSGTERRVEVRVPSDATDPEEFFRVLPSHATATPEMRREAGRRLLALSEMGWRSDGPYGSRDELYDR